MISDIDGDAGPIVGHQEWRVMVLPLARTFSVKQGQTLIEAAEQQGVFLPSSCRAGSCRVCLSHLAQGAVTYSVPWPGLAPEERAAGWILPCVAKPTETLTLVQEAAREVPPTAPGAALAAIRANRGY